MGTQAQADADSRFGSVIRSLRNAAEHRGMRVTTDGRVGEADAAILLDLQPASLKALRNSSKGPSFYYRGAGNGSKVSYRIDDLAAWLEQGRVDV